MSTPRDCSGGPNRVDGTLWIADAHRDNEKCFVVQAEEKLTAFLELESAICASSELA